MSFFPSIFCTISAFSLYGLESTSYVLSFRMVFFYLVTTGWIFDISECEKSINQSINYTITMTINSNVLRIPYLSFRGLQHPAFDKFRDAVCSTKYLIHNILLIC